MAGFGRVDYVRRRVVEASWLKPQAQGRVVELVNAERALARIRNGRVTHGNWVAAHGAGAIDHGAETASNHWNSVIWRSLARHKRRN